LRLIGTNRGPKVPHIYHVLCILWLTIDQFHWPEEAIVKEMIDVAQLFCDLTETFRNPNYGSRSSDNLGSDLYRLWASCQRSGFLRAHKKVINIRAIVDQVRFSWKSDESVT